MARRGENIYKRKDGRWEGRYMKGKDENGKIHFGYVYGYAYKEVKTKLLPLKHYYSSQGPGKVNLEITFGDWTRCWMEEIIKSRVKESTFANYNSMLQRHILPYFGGRKLAIITVRDIQEYIDRLQKEKLNTNTLRNIIAMINRILKGAVKKKVILVNPCDGVELPERTPVRVHAMSKEEQRRLEQAVSEDKNGMEVMIALYTGMRIGEICGLKWSDIDFLAGTIHVRRTIQRIEVIEGENKKTKLIMGTPKSSRSERIIPLPQKLLRLLKKQKFKAKSEYVITCKGNHAEPRTVRYRYQRILEKAGLKTSHFHALRHTFATRCIEMQMDIAVISRILGHSSIKMTMDVYLDATLEHKAQCIQKLDHLYDIRKQLI